MEVKHTSHQAGGSPETPADAIPEGTCTDLAGTLTYGKHLLLDQLLSA
jgi:hypothetical protein